MLYCGIILIVLASIIGGWVFMCDALPIVEQPRLVWSPIPLLIALLVALVGIVILFFAKWSLGLIGLGASVTGFNLFAGIWHMIYKRFHL